MANKKARRMQPLNVQPYGARKTIFVNFSDTCNTMQRQVRAAVQPVQPAQQTLSSSHHHGAVRSTCSDDAGCVPQADHVLSYLLAELGTQGSIDGKSRLVLKVRVCVFASTPETNVACRTQ